MKWVRFLLRFILSLLLAILVIVIGLNIAGQGHLVKAVRSTYLVGKTGPSIEDHKKFKNREVRKGPSEEWPKSAHYNRYRLNQSEDSIFDRWESVAFLLIQNDSLLFEQYWDGYSESSYSNSFSVAKSLVSLAIGAAIQEGCIQSTNEPVHHYLEEFKEGERRKIKIKDLLKMSSGINFGESYGDPFGFMSKTYYGDELYDLTLHKEVEYGPSEYWKYQGGNTLLLMFILKEACGKSLSEFFSEQIWSKIGSSNNALWTINEEGWEKSYCCFYSNARDYARIGKLMLDSGLWNGKRLIDRNYFKEMIEPVMLPNESGKTIDYYAYHWWLTEFDGQEVIYARGILGQYILIIPDRDLIMVRLGHKRDPNVGAEVPIDLIDYLNISLRILEERP